MSFKKIVIILIVIPACLFIVSRIFPKEANKVFVSPLATSVSSVHQVIQSITKDRLAKVVDLSLAGTQGTYGIVIKNLKTGESYTRNENMKFDSASIYKLWVLGAVYEKIHNGELSGGEVLSRDATELNKMFDIASEAAELTDGTITMKVDDAIERMITVSDNYSALLLASKIRNSKISSFIEKQGFTDSSLGEPPETSPEDIALFYEKLYKGEIIDEQTSAEMLEILKRQQLNDVIPKYLPENIDVAHKTGEFDGYKHDAGIIYGKDPILIVVLSESNSPQGAADRIADLSRNIFNYFEGK